MADHKHSQPRIRVFNRSYVANPTAWNPSHISQGTTTPGRASSFRASLLRQRHKRKHPDFISRDPNTKRLRQESNTFQSPRFDQNVRVNPNPRIPFGNPSGINPALAARLRTRVGMSFTMRRRKRRRTGVKNIARLALSKVRRLEKKIEVKSHFIALVAIVNVGSTIATGADIRALHLIAQGDGIGDRDANKIHAFFLNMKIHWVGLPASVNDIWRIIILRDSQQIADTVPAITDVLQEETSLSLKNFTNRRRFKILFDQMFNGGTDTAILQTWLLNVSIKLNFRIGFGGAASTTITENGLYMITISGGTTNRPSVSHTSRLFYNDG